MTQSAERIASEREKRKKQDNCRSMFPTESVGFLTFRFCELLSGKRARKKAPAEAEGRRYKWHSQDQAALERVASVKSGDW